MLDGKEVAIDHGLALRKKNPIGNNLSFYDQFRKAFNINPDHVRSQKAYPRSKPEMFVGEPFLLARFRMTTYKKLEELLKDTLDKRNIKLVFSKITKLLKYTSQTNKNYLRLNLQQNLLW